MIAIVLYTCARPLERGEYARRAIQSLAEHNLHCDDDELWLHISDDGSPQDFRDEIMFHARDVFGDHTSLSNAHGKGYGGSYNRASQSVHGLADLLMPLEDDWELVRDFDLTSFARILRAGHFNCIRMGYVGYTNELRGTLCSYEGQHFIRFDPDSLEKHVFTGGPRLETREFERTIGAWPEQLGAGATELVVCSRPEARKGVAWPISAIKLEGDLFVHIGSIKADIPNEEAVGVVE